MRKYVLLSLDLLWVALSPAIALLVRGDFDFQINKLEQALPYTAMTVAAAALVFLVAGLHTRIWRYTSLGDILRVMAAATVTMGVALFAAFAWNRLDGVARSLPLIQWLVMVAGLAGMRVAVRLIRGRGARDLKESAASTFEHVLIVGLNPVTELYLRSVRTFAPGRISVVGLLAEGSRLKGRIVQFHKILGTPEQLSTVLYEQEVHGVAVGRIVITEPFETLSPEAREALIWAEKARDVTLDFFGERLGLFAPAAGAATSGSAASAVNGGAPPPNGAGNNGAGNNVPGRGLDRLVSALALPALTLSHPADMHARWALASAPALSHPADMRARWALASVYGAGRLKRLVDFVVAAGCILLLTPVFALLSGLVALGLGLPLTFWQTRPGRFGRPFRLYKFRSFHPPHDETGRPLSDAERETGVGRLLRRFRLDELPQLYNILVGEMSFVGPRPLLPVDQPPIEALPVEALGGSEARLALRPGLTGWAQVNGGRDMSVEDKMALDLWYMQNASLALDVKIVWRTVLMVLLGERLNGLAVHEAWAGLGLRRPITLPHLASALDSVPPPIPEPEPDARPARSNVLVAPAVTVAGVAAEIAGREAA